MRSNPIRVLLVHPEGSEGQRLLNVLTSGNGRKLDVVILSRVSTACERLTEEQFDLILLDLAIPDEPGLDGFIRLNAQTPATPLVVIASAGTQDLANAALESGAADSLVRSALEREPVDDILFAIIQRNRFQEAIRKQSFLDDETGLYTREGFEAMAIKHLALALHGEKELLLGAFRVESEGEARDRLEVAARLIKRSFRESDIVARFDPTLFVVLGIVQPADNSEEIVALRMSEWIHDHNATHPAELQFRLRCGLARLTAAGRQSVESLVDAIPRPDRVLPAPASTAKQ